MLLVAGTLTVAPERHAELVDATRTLVTATRAEAGCIRYGLWADPDRPGHLLAFEEWESEAHLDAHLQRPHLREFQTVLARLGLIEAGVRRYLIEEVRPL